MATPLSPMQANQPLQQKIQWKRRLEEIRFRCQASGNHTYSKNLLVKICNVWLNFLEVTRRPTRMNHMQLILLQPCQHPLRRIYGYRLAFHHSMLSCTWKCDTVIQDGMGWEMLVPLYFSLLSIQSNHSSDARNYFFCYAPSLCIFFLFAFCCSCQYLKVRKVTKMQIVII